MKSNLKDNMWKVLAAALIGIVLVIGLAGSVSASVNGPTDIPEGRVSQWSTTYTLFPSEQITVATAKYSAAPKTVSGLDASNIVRWNSADVFVTADVSGTVTLIVTPQLSIDQANWANAKFSYITTTTPLNGVYNLTLTADGTDYLRVPLAGAYLRFMVTAGGATSANTVTPTIKVVYKNY